MWGNEKPLFHIQELDRLVWEKIVGTLSTYWALWFKHCPVLLDL